MDYEEFYMNIENKNTVIVARIAPGKLPKTYQGTIAQDTLIVDTIKFFHRCLAEGHIKGLDELKVLGSYLYKLLFDANISSVFKDDFDKNEKREDSSTTRLRIILEFKEAASDLAILPWEYIYYPEGQSFLADNNRLILTRHVPCSDLFSKLTADQESLNILVVVSKPEIRPTLAGNNEQYTFYHLSADLEAELARLFHKDEAQPLLIMEIAQFQELMGTLAQVTFPPHSALLVETAELRPFVRKIIETSFPKIPVLSVQELLPGLERNIANTKEAQPVVVDGAGASSDAESEIVAVNSENSSQKESASHE